jgi:hypothetical protein
MFGDYPTFDTIYSLNYYNASNVYDAQPTLRGLLTYLQWRDATGVPTSLSTVNSDGTVDGVSSGSEPHGRRLLQSLSNGSSGVTITDPVITLAGTLDLRAVGECRCSITININFIN